MGAADSKEGRKLIKQYQQKHRTLTQVKTDRLTQRLFNVYDKGAKGYLVETEVKKFLRDTLDVSEITPDPLKNLTADDIIDLMWKEIDTSGRGQIASNELIKPSWGNIQSSLEKAYQKQNQNSNSNLNSSPAHVSTAPGAPVLTTPLPFPNTAPTTTTTTTNATTTTMTTTNQTGVGVHTILQDSSVVTVNHLEDNCPHAFICPITQEMMTDPVLLCETHHTYERTAIEEWLLKHSHDPSTLIPVTNKTLIPNISLRQAIEEWTEKETANYKKRKIDERKRREEKEKKEKEEKEKGMPTLNEEEGEEPSQSKSSEKKNCQKGKT